MLDALFVNRVTVRRAETRGVNNEVVYKQVLDMEDEKAGGPAILNCRIERRRRRIITEAREELTTDATMLFRVVPLPAIEMTDVIVDEKGNAYKVAGLESDNALFGEGEYVRADLTKTELEVPPDKDDGRPDLGRP
jgi:hypothetical protein